MMIFISYSIDVLGITIDTLNSGLLIEDGL